MPKRFFLHSFYASRPHLSLAILFGCIIGPFLPHDWPFMTRLLVAWNAAVWSYLVTISWMIMRANHHTVRERAAKQDERAAVVLVALSIASIMSLAAIVSQLSQLKDLPADARAAHYILAGVTLLGSWSLVGMMFCMHYAHLYYLTDSDARPLQFPEDEENPEYWDFLYFSFTIAVAVQTSDVEIHNRQMRKIVIGQSILNFFFNLVVLGLSINIAAGLLKS